MRQLRLAHFLFEIFKKCNTNKYCGYILPKDVIQKKQTQQQNNKTNKQTNKLTNGGIKMKKMLIFICSMALALLLAACFGGGRYTCKDCDKTTSKAYYDMNSNKESVMCEGCARKYRLPLDYRTYRVK